MSDWTAYKYSVSLTPAVDSRRLRIRIVKGMSISNSSILLFSLHHFLSLYSLLISIFPAPLSESPTLRGRPCLFDGQELYVKRELSEAERSCETKNPLTREPMRVRFTLLAQFTPQSADALALLGVLVRAALPRLGLVQMGRGGEFYFPPGPGTASWRKGVQVGDRRYCDRVFHIF